MPDEVCAVNLRCFQCRGAQTNFLQTKDMLCHALKARWRTEVSPEEVAQIVEESAQLSIELTCDDVKKLTDRSFSFARKKLGYVIETE